MKSDLEPAQRVVGKVPIPLLAATTVRYKAAQTPTVNTRLIVLVNEPLSRTEIVEIVDRHDDGYATDKPSSERKWREAEREAVGMQKIRLEGTNQLENFRIVGDA